MSEPGFASLGPTLLARKGGAKPAMRPQLPPMVQDEAELAALADEQLEDLGWNDMGDGESDDAAPFDQVFDPGDHPGADVVPINAAMAGEGFAAASTASPIVRRQQRRLEERVLAVAVMTGTDDEDFEDDSEFGEGDDPSECEVDHDRDENEAESAAPAYHDAPLPVAALQAVPARTSAGPARRPAVTSGRRAAFTLRLDADRHLKLRLVATMQGISAQALLTEALDAMLAEFDDLDSIAARLKRH